MTTNPPMAAVIRPRTATRVVDGKLCLINQTRGEAWICRGISRQVWDQLEQRRTIPDIARALAWRYDMPAEKTLADVSAFVESLWRRQIVDVPGREHVSDAERAAMVTEMPHNERESGRLFRLSLKANTIYVAWLDLLIPCNLRCRHCYLDFSKTDILPLPKVLSILDQLADHGTVELILTGGEIFLRKDLLDIVAHAERRGFLFDLYTNGNFIDEKMADRLAAYAIYKVQLSVYGTSAAVHEAITKKPGTFDKSIRAARLLIERGIRVRLQCHIQQDNYEDAYRFPDFAHSLGAEYRFDTKLVPNRNGSTVPLDFGVTVAQQARLYESGLVDRLKADSLCTAASAKARITAAGDIYPCDLISNVTIGNLHQHTLAEIWSSSRRSDLRETILGYKPHRCGGCGHTTDCNPCAALRGFNQEGHMEAPVSEACMLTTANLISRGKPIASNSPSGVAAAAHGGCFDHVLAQNAGQMVRQPLIQITTRQALEAAGGR
jgi:radical SAM protein with 4Fe4S-binding SPASM domain